MMSKNIPKINLKRIEGKANKKLNQKELKIILKQIEFCRKLFKICKSNKTIIKQKMKVIIHLVIMRLLNKKIPFLCEILLKILSKNKIHRKNHSCDKFQIKF